MNSLLHLLKKNTQVVPPQKTFVPLLSSTCVDLYVYNFNEFHSSDKLALDFLVIKISKAEEIKM